MRTHESEAGIGDYVADALVRELVARRVTRPTAAAAAAAVRASGRLADGATVVIERGPWQRRQAYGIWSAAVAAVAADAETLAAVRAAQVADGAGRRRVPITTRMAYDAGYAVTGPGARDRGDAPCPGAPRESDSPHEAIIRAAMGASYEAPLDCGQTERDETRTESRALLVDPGLPPEVMPHGGTIGARCLWPRP